MTTLRPNGTVRRFSDHDNKRLATLVGRALRQDGYELKGALTHTWDGYTKHEITYRDDDLTTVKVEVLPGADGRVAGIDVRATRLGKRVSTEDTRYESILHTVARATGYRP